MASSLFDRQSRKRLANSVRTLRATHGYTNFDEAAKLVELLSYQLRGAYGRSADRFMVRAFTDYESRPYADKPKFSLVEYLAQRLNARHIRVSVEDQTTSQQLQVQAMPQSAAAGQRPNQYASARSRSRFWVETVVIGAGVLLITLLGLWLTSRPQATQSAPASLGAILVTEKIDQPTGNTSDVIVKGHRINVNTWVPVMFSTEPERASYIAARAPGTADGDLFSVTPMPQGRVNIQSRHTSVVVDGKRLGHRSLRVALDKPVEIRVGHRLFELTGVFATAHPAARGEQLFYAKPMTN